MNTGETIEAHYPGGIIKIEPVIWCDICGYGARHGSNINDKYHFCHRHKEKDIRAFMNGSLTGYFEHEAQQELPFQ